MPAPHPPEFRERAVELARERPSRSRRSRRIWGSPRAACGAGCTRPTSTRAQEGLTTTEREELVKLRRENRTLAMENEILKRAAAYFAKENVLPK